MHSSKSKFKLMPLLIGVGLLVDVFAPAYAVMQAVDDSELSEQTGQAAFYTSYNAPSGSGTGATPDDYGFFTFGLNGELDLNANINHLQLGCGGVNGAGCDIDINQLGLSGNPGVGSCPSGASRATCDAVITNPFLQLAIKSPNSLSTRQIVGINFGAQNVMGLLTAGVDNPSSLNGSATNPKGVGINSFSGYMNIGSATGTANTAYTIISYDGANTPATQANGSTVPTNQPTTGTNTAITGRIYNVGNSCTFGCTNFSSTSYDLVLPSVPVTLTSNPTVANGTRMTSVALTGTGAVNPINFTGSMTASAAGLNLAENIVAPSSINNLSVSLQVQEALSYIHNISLNNPVSLSLQSTQVQYPGSASTNIAQPGWWMSVGNTVNIGSISPAASVALSVPVLQTVLNDTSTYLYNNPISCGALGLASCLGGSLSTGVVNLAGNAVNFPLVNTVLAAQTPVSNCYGGLKFC